jgi:hypothetical protein
MAHWAIRKEVVDSIGSGGTYGHALWFLSIICAIIGIISDLGNWTLGLKTMYWFQLAIVLGILSISIFIGWAVAWYLKTTEK